MPLALLQRVTDECRTREPLVRVAGLLHGARVLAAFDEEAGKRWLAEAVTALDRIPPGPAVEALFDEVIRVGAAVDPAAAAGLFRSLPGGEDAVWRHSAGVALVHSLAKAGDFDTALELLPLCRIGGAEAVVQLASDPEVRRRALRVARDCWRMEREGKDPSRSFEADFHYFRLFGLHWRALDRAEASSWLDEILDAIEAAGRPVRAGYGKDVQLDSARDMHLFDVLGALRNLVEPARVETILGGHPAVREASMIYPLGLVSVMSESRAAAPAEPPGGAGFSGVGSRYDRVSEGLVAARAGDPSATRLLLDEAHRLYLEDLDRDNPNLAPRVLWPSCQTYRMAMYWAGRQRGIEAEAMLAEIPDADFTLLAAIELAAGALRVPGHSGPFVQRRGNRLRYPAP